MRLFVFALALLLAACGAPEPAPTAATPAPAPAATPAPAPHDHAAHGDAADGSVEYYCPMHPEVTADEAGQRCGKCNMFLVAPGDEDKHTGD